MGHDKCILVMDDDPHACAYLADLIRYFGFSVECVGSHEGVLRRLKEKTFAGLILDQWVDDDCTSRILGWLRENRREEPVIAMSTMADYDQWIDLVNKGATDLIAKPVQPGQLKRALQLAVGEKYFADQHDWQSIAGS